MDKRSTRQASTIPVIALFCALFFSATVIIAHLVKSELDFFSHALSFYALGNNGFILELGFYAIAANQLLLGYLLLSHDSRRRAIPAAVFLCLAGLGALLVAIFPTQPDPVDLVSRLPHITGAMAQLLLFPVALLALSSRLPNGPIRAYTEATAYITLCLFFVSLALFFVPELKHSAFFGLVEKLDVFIINIWLIYYSWFFFQLNRSPAMDKQDI